MNAPAWYALAASHDAAGREIEAELGYRKVYELGVSELPMADQLGFYVGFGSTLRNNGKLEESQRTLREGIARFPDSPVLKVFLSLTLYSGGFYQESAQVLLKMAGELPPPVIDGYERAVKHYSKNLPSGF